MIKAKTCSSPCRTLVVHLVSFLKTRYTSRAERRKAESQLNTGLLPRALLERWQEIGPIQKTQCPWEALGTGSDLEDLTVGPTQPTHPTTGRAPGCSGFTVQYHQGVTQSKADL